MAILRNPNKSKFTIVNNCALMDDALSLKARGLLASMLSLPDNWQFSEEGLCNIFKKDKRDSIRSGLKELEARGYLVRTRKRDDSGRITAIRWTVYDSPRTEKPMLENPMLENPMLEKQTLENQPQLNTKETNTK